MCLRGSVPEKILTAGALQPTSTVCPFSLMLLVRLQLCFALSGSLDK
jgi:hypothetical protein